jgi:spermidine synthase
MIKRTAAVLPLLALACSGMAGLVDEVVWARVLSTLFGSVLAATGLLMALFMACLGLGAHLGGRLTPRLKRPLLAYGLLEAAIGIMVLATPPLLKSIEPWILGLYGAHSPWTVNLLTAAACMAILGPVILLMGATFPVFLAWALGGGRSLNAGTGLVYGINTLGAVLGTIGAGFVLLPVLGIRGSLITAALADIAVGLVCILLGYKMGTVPIFASGEPRVAEIIGTVPIFDARLAWGTAFLGGFAALALEVAWFRALTLVFGSSVYALTLMLAAFLTGLGLGAFLFPRLSARSPEPRRFLGLCHAGVALTATLVSLLIQVLPLLFILLLRASHGGFRAWSAGTFVLLALWFLAPTVLMGMALPAAIGVGAGGRDDGEAPRAAGRVYGASSLGSALGALAAGFLLVPLLGLRGALASAVLCSLAAAGWALWRSGDREGRKRGMQVGGVAALVWGLWFGGVLPWDWRVLTAGYYAYAHLYTGNALPAPAPTARRVEMADPLPFTLPDPPPVPYPQPMIGRDGETGVRLVSWEEGRFAQVAVVEAGPVRSLLINGKADASSGRDDMRTQLLLGHLPALLSPDPPGGNALVVGLGSAVTLSAVEAWPYASIEAVEIEPAVARAARLFGSVNRRVLDSPRVRLRLDDARRVLFAEEESLALITSEPSNLWMSGVSLLFTREFFQRAAERLAERGVLCQWIHLYQIGPEDVKTLLATVSGSFPRLAVFSDGADLLIVASRAPLTLDPAVWRTRVESSPAAREALLRAGFVSAADLAAGLIADERGVALWARGAPLHTDDRPLLEFTAARSMGYNLAGPILAGLVEAGRAAGTIPLGASGEIR